MLGLRDGCSHAWIQREGLIIDITADQFDDVTEPVIVSDSSPWHDSFEPEDLHSADFMIYDEHTRMTLAGAYSIVCKQLPEELRPSRP